MAMKDVMDNIFPCYDSSTDGGNDITGWTRNESNSEVIEVLVYPYMFLKFTQLNASHYRWCGHQLLIVEYFAKLINTKYIYHFVYL